MAETFDLKKLVGSTLTGINLEAGSGKLTLVFQATTIEVQADCCHDSSVVPDGPFLDIVVETPCRFNDVR